RPSRRGQVPLQVQSPHHPAYPLPSLYWKIWRQDEVGAHVRSWPISDEPQKFADVCNPNGSRHGEADFMGFDLSLLPGARHSVARLSLRTADLQVRITIHERTWRSAVRMSMRRRATEWRAPSGRLLRRLRNLLGADRGDLGLGLRAALVELGEPLRRMAVHDVVGLARVLLRPGPAVGGDVEDDAVEVGVLDLVAMRVVGVAHDPGRAGVARDLALLDHVVDPEADMVDADEIRAGALRGLVALEMEDGEVDHAVGQEHALGKRAVELDDLFQAQGLLVELGGLPRVG